jgi:outer membrane protein assembly factor BamB
MWVAAIGTVVLLAWARSRSGERAAARSAHGAPTHGPDDRAPSGSRLDRTVEPPPPGPPRMFRFDRRHTGRSPYLGPTAPKVAFRFETEGRITAQPVIADGRVHVGSHDGFLYVIDEGGDLVWKRDLEDRIYAAAFVDDEGNVFVGSDADTLWSFDRNGELRFRLATEGDADTGVVPSPRGLLHFAAGPHLWAIQPDGVVEWRFEARSKIFTTPTVDDDGTVYVGSLDDHVYAVSPEGRMRWSYRTGADNESSIVLGDDGSLYFGSDDKHVYALDRDGKLRWSAETRGYVRGPIGLGIDGTVLAGTFGPTPALLGLSPKDGQVRFRFDVTKVDSTEIGVAAGPLVDRDGHIYFGAHDDYVYSLTGRGELRWLFRTEGDVDSPPVLGADGRLYVGSDDRSLRAIEDDTE